VTTYAEVGPEDHDVAVFLVQHLQFINIWRLPLKAWVAREDGRIVAVMTFDNITYPAIHVIVADPDSRPFMRIAKLWLMAYQWFKDIQVPLICAPVFNHLHHFQSLVRRLGFRKIGVETNDAGVEVETIYGYFFNEESA
jgi:hypothetical protein